MALYAKEKGPEQVLSGSISFALSSISFHDLRGKPNDAHITVLTAYLRQHRRERARRPLPIIDLADVHSLETLEAGDDYAVFSFFKACACRREYRPPFPLV
jgi:hypothetical protein